MTRLATIIALVVAVSLPFGYILTALEDVRESLEFKAKVKASALNGLIANGPDVWMFAENRMQGLLSREPIPLDRELVQIFDRQGKILVESGKAPPAPVMSRSSALLDSGQVVGRVEVIGSLREMILKSFGAALIGLMLGLLVFVIMRMLPLRALRKATNALSEEKDRVEAMLHSISDAVITTDAQGVLKQVNPAGLAMLEADLPEQLIGHGAMDLIAPEYRSVFADHHKRVLSGEAMQLQYEVLGIRGGRRWWETQAVPLHDHGEIVHLAVARDITERKKTDLELEQHRNHLEQIVQERTAELRVAAAAFESQQAMMITNADRVILKINRAFTEITGYSASEVEGQHLSLLRSVRHNADFYDAIWETVKRTGGWQGEVWDRRKNGNEYPKWLTISELKDHSGAVTHYISVHHDITDHKRAEASIRESEEKYRSILENIDELYFELDLKGNITFFNDSTCRISGYSPSEAMGMNYRRYTSPETAKQVKALFGNIYLSGENSSIGDFDFIDKDKSIHSLELSVKLLKNPAGEAIGFRCIARDITQRKQADMALRVSEHKYRLLAENSVAAIWTVNLEGTFTYVSSSVEKLLGYTVDEVMEIQMPGIIATEDYENLMMILSAELAKPKEERLPSHSQQLRCKRKDGSLLDTEINVAWLKDDQGNIVGLQGSTSDITGRKKAEEEKEKLQGQLVQSQKMESVGRLAGGVAHDFNNMLSLIIGHTELALEQTDPTHPLHTDLQEIRKAAERSADLTRQLLAFARRQTAALKVLDLNQTITDMLKMLQRLIGEDIDLKWQSKANLWTVKMDPTQIDQILANLCINARDAIAGVGKLTIETGNISLDEAYCAIHAGFVPGEYVTLIVSDNGCGMAKETIENIFEPFFTTKGLGKGTGLGLATVFGIVKQNNGFINVYSEPGQGTTFTLYLPRYVGKVELAQPESIRRPDLHGQETILLVEDEPDILNLTTMLLERQGYTVLAANTPGKAISLAGEHTGAIDLLMTDVVMPEMNGRDLAKTLSDLYPHLKRLFTSGYTADVIAHHGVLDEGVHFIQKPFSIKALAAKIREVLDKA